MLEILHQLSDNQLALLGCLGAIGGACLLLSVSYHANPANRIDRQKRNSNVAKTESEAASQSESHRRAA